ncbi:MAG: acyltransferase [Clostridium sp.]
MKTRENNIDNLRVYAAILVIVLHSCAIYLIANMQSFNLDFSTASIISVFTRVSVPIFVMISGRYLLSNYNELSIGEFYKRKLPRILIPLVVWNVVYLLLRLLTESSYTLAKGFKEIILGGSSIHLWFFYLIFLLYVLTPFINKIISKISKKDLIRLTIALLFIGFICELARSLTGFINLPIYYPVEFIGYYIAGFALKDYSPKLNKNYFLFGYIGLALLGGILSCYFQSISSIASFYPHTSINPLTLFATLSLYIYASNSTANLSNSSISTSNEIDEIREVSTNSDYTPMSNKIKTTKPFKIAALSKYTLGIYAIHFAVLSILTNLTNRSITGIVFLDIFIYTALAFFISLILSMVLYKFKLTRSLVN